MKIDLKKIGEYLTEKDMWDKSFKDFNKVEFECLCAVIREYTRVKIKQKPEHCSECKEHEYIEALFCKQADKPVYFMDKCPLGYWPKNKPVLGVKK